MNNDLYNKLLEAYTVEKLNQVTAKIIESYRNKYYGRLEKLVKSISHICDFKDSKINKYFSRLVLMYHPDKINYYKNRLNDYQKTGDNSILTELSHILIILDLIDIKPSDFKINDSNIMDGFEMEFGFDDNDLEDIHHWSVYDPEENMSFDKTNSFASDFINLLKIKEFGQTDRHIPEYELQNLTGPVDLSKMQMNDLNGIELCINLKSLDLSDNQIADITSLGYLSALKELDLSHNAIDDISALAGLYNLETLDLAFNNIDDISSLYDLAGLTYVNLVGNPVPTKQLLRIQSADRIVVC
ncbi:MAG: leucine-rich repeat domain-containing protein [Calditrichaceae bacterium]|nr:leucine-rich repeat domain-containing protein [Calditrichaceae bacterium]